MDEFIDDMRLILGVLGHKILEPSIKRKSDENFTFTQDWAFTSPSLAAAIVVGYSINGREIEER